MHAKLELPDTTFLLLTVLDESLTRRSAGAWGHLAAGSTALNIDRFQKVYWQGLIKMSYYCTLIPDDN